ncbi:right-handed parallel beta-helix repeat-containing protein [Thalassotalea euphylliae]|uniref:Right-handed parallel beta-helix repeat-containing protein n=1 Tax=Thalassotalea euphylliae TaxID=1655234 RepID=A0A3E0UBA2_9GAMM|nr:right-handed parallel beta-helix repeat-containing protein [Thalassotalea euphylliae]REL33994.1 right-handed parallel beta-helix repeat-containing protein [Thalassotalea euphylliae]
MKKLIAILYVIIAYGSLYPFLFSLEELSASSLIWLNINIPSIGDVLGNLLLFLPLGVAYRLSALKQGLHLSQVDTWLRPFGIVLFFAFILQVLQIGIAERDPNLIDVLFNSIGFALGFIAINFFDRVKVSLENPIAMLPIAIVIVYLLSQLAPFVPSIDFQAFKHSIKPLLVPPSASNILLVLFNTVTWLVMFRLLSFWRPVPLTFFVFGYFGLLVAKVVIYQNSVTWAVIIAPSIGYLIFRLRDWHDDGNQKQLYVLFLASIFFSSLISAGKPIHNAFSMLPFHSYLSGQVYAGVSTILLKVSLFSAAMWLSLELKYSLHRQAYVLAGLVLITECSQIFISGRTFDIGDVVLVGVTFLLVRHIGDLLASMLGNVTEHYRSQTQDRVPKTAISCSKEKNTSVFLTSLLVGGFMLLYMAISLVLLLPSIPYNVRELFENNGSILDVLFFYVFLLCIFGGGYWSASTIKEDCELRVSEFIGTQVKILLIAFIAITLAISEESLQDIIGASVYARDILAMRAESSWLASLLKILSLSMTANFVRYVEYFVRFSAFIGFIYFPLLLTLFWVRKKQAITNKFKVTIVSSGAIVFCYITVFINASTDNLTELIESPIAISTAFISLSILAGLAYLIVSVKGTARLIWFPLIILSSIASSWYTLNYGLEPVIVKYGQTFSAADFLLGPDRENQLSQSELVIRWSVLVLGLIFVTCFACTVSRAALNLKGHFNTAFLPKESSVLYSAAGVFCLYLLYRIFGEPFHIQTISSMLNPPAQEVVKVQLQKLTNLKHAPGVITLDGKPVKDFQTALKTARAFSEINIGRGLYKASGVVTANNVKITAEPGAVIFGSASQGKGAIVAKGNNLIIDGLECHSISVPSNNGVCVRLEGRGLTLNNVYFHHAQGGLLGSPKGGDIVIQNSRFEYMGHGSFFHGVYTMAKTRLLIKNSSFLNNQTGGHEIKSRSYYTEILESVIGSSLTRDSRLIDIPNGGQVRIENSVLVEGAYSENHDLLSWGVEGVSHDEGSIVIRNNIFIADKSYARLIAMKEEPQKLDISDNIIVGGIEGAPKAFNIFFEDRADLGIKPAPFIPNL